MEATICRTSIAMHACGSMASQLLSCAYNSTLHAWSSQQGFHIARCRAAISCIEWLHQIVRMNALHVVSVLDSMHVRALWRTNQSHQCVFLYSAWPRHIGTTRTVEPTRRCTIKFKMHSVSTMIGASCTRNMFVRGSACQMLMHVLKVSPTLRWYHTSPVQRPFSSCTDATSPWWTWRCPRRVTEIDTCMLPMIPHCAQDLTTARGAVFHEPEHKEVLGRPWPSCKSWSWTRKTFFMMPVSQFVSAGSLDTARDMLPNLFGSLCFRSRTKHANNTENLLSICGKWIERWNLGTHAALPYTRLNFSRCETIALCNCIGVTAPGVAASLQRFSTTHNELKQSIAARTSARLMSCSAKTAWNTG